MDFSKAQFESLLADISAGMDDLSLRLDQIEPAAIAAADRWYIPAGVADSIIWLGRETVEVGRKVLNFLKDLLKGATAPIFMFMDAWDWMDVRGSASGIASALTEQHLVVDNSDWSGKARDAYVSSVASHREAATRISSIASSTSGHLLACAAAGAAFYTTLAVVLAKLIAAAIEAIAAFGSAVFSWAGAAIVLEEAASTLRLSLPRSRLCPPSSPRRRPAWSTCTAKRLTTVRSPVASGLRRTRPPTVMRRSRMETRIGRSLPASPCRPRLQGLGVRTGRRSLACPSPRAPRQHGAVAAPWLPGRTRQHSTF